MLKVIHPSTSIIIIFCLENCEADQVTNKGDKYNLNKDLEVRLVPCRYWAVSADTVFGFLGVDLSGWHAQI